MTLVLNVLVVLALIAAMVVLSILRRDIRSLVIEVGRMRAADEAALAATQAHEAAQDARRKELLQNLAVIRAGGGRELLRDRLRTRAAKG